jgi:uncharacterized coiled-coil protein SlyX
LATLEERLAALEGDYSVVVQSIALKLDEHLVVQKSLRLEIREQGKKIDEFKMRMATVESRLNHMDVKLGSLNENVKSLRGDMDRRFDQMDQKFDQVIALLAPRAKGTHNKRSGLAVFAVVIRLANEHFDTVLECPFAWYIINFPSWRGLLSFFLL